MSTASKFACLLSTAATLVLAAMAWVAAHFLAPALSAPPSRPMQLVPVVHRGPAMPIAPLTAPSVALRTPEPMAARWQLGPDGSLVFPMEVRPPHDFPYISQRSEP